jgi:hypothetical protein
MGGAYRLRRAGSSRPGCPGAWAEVALVGQAERDQVGPLGIHPGVLAPPPRPGTRHRHSGPLLVRHGASMGGNPPVEVGWLPRSVRPRRPLA